MRSGVRLTFLFFLFLAHISFAASVTYEFSGGRFGDNLLAYVHAKWIAFIYDIPLKYRPFRYSDQLELHIRESSNSQHKRIKKLTKDDMVIHKDDPILHVIPYFGESPEEQQKNQHWINFKVDWDNPAFHEQLCEMISPIDKSLLEVDLPEDCFTIALHMRRGGGYDGANCFWADPLKFPPISFFIQQLRVVHEYIGKEKIYVYIFTDDANPPGLVRQFADHFADCDNITFNCRERDNFHSANVLKDFFAMTKFDCIIHAHSNYSNIAAAVGWPKIEIYPIKYAKSGRNITIIETEFKRRF